MPEADKDGTPPAGGAPKPETVYLNASAEQLKARFGGADQAIMRLWRDGKVARDKRRVAEARVVELEAQVKPKEGTIVLSGENAKAYTAFTALGKTPAELKTVLDSHTELSTRVTKADRKDTAAKAGKAVKWNAENLATLAEDKGLNLIVKTEKDGSNNDVDVPYVQPAEQGATPVKLTDYVKQHLPAYLPMLTAAQSGTDSSARSATGDATRTAFVEQSATSGNATDANAPKPLPLREKRVLPSQRNATP